MSTALSIFICLLLTLGGFLLSSCGGKTGNESSQGVKSETPVFSAAESGEPTSSSPIIEDDFGDRDIIFLTIGGANQVSEVIFNETLSEGEQSWMTVAVNEAIRERNNRAESYLNCHIKELAITSDRVGREMLSYVRNELAGGQHTFDICAPSIYDCGTLAAEGSFLNLIEIPSLNTQNPWWDQSFNSSMTINGCLYFTLGDIGLFNKNATPVVYFNKNLAGDHGLEPSVLYGLVRDNKWTFDKAYEYAKLLSVDVDDNAVIDFNDKVGWAGQADDTWNFFFASGERIVTQSGEKTLELTMFGGRSVNVAEKMYTMFRDTDHYISANNYFNVSGTPTYECTGKAFLEGRVMFFSDNMAFMHFFAGMDDEFGVLPTPKFDDAQDDYFSLINPWTGNAFALPAVLSEEDAYYAGGLLDVMGYYSVETVAYEYVQRTLKYQKTRDDDSVDMIQLIFDTRGCDIGIIYNIGLSSGTSLPTMLQNLMNSPGSTFTAAYEAIATAAQLDLDEVIDLYTKNG